jgi:peptidoglycan/LPS O-acetylase OafA/YrhL
VHNNRVFGLDLLRAIAITLVVVSHCTYILIEETNNPFIISLRSLGAIGVDLFFVLSGYLIGGILLKRIQNDKTSFKDFVWFWKRRWFRTLPNYFLVLVINILIIVAIDGYLPNTFYLYVPFLQNFISPHPDFFTEAWSLSIEEYSYLILPLILFFSLLLFKRRYSKKTIFLWVTLSIILIQFLIKIEYYILANSISIKEWSSTFRKVVIYRLDVIYYGFILIYCIKEFPEFFKKYRNHLFLFSLVLFSITHLSIYSFELMPQTNLAFYVFAYLPIIAICCAFTFPFAIQLKAFKRINKLIYFISTRSYAIYLINYSMVLLNFKKVLNLESMSLFMKAITILIFIMVTLILSEMLYRFFEKPILNYRDR